MKKKLFHFRQSTYLFTFAPRFALLCGFLFILCCVLGMWQIHRYHAKKNLLVTYQKRLHATPIPFSHLTHPEEFQRVIVRGQLDTASTIFIQNQFYHDQLGYEVFMPLKIKNEKKLLWIDQGWVPITYQLKSSHSTHALTLTGYLKSFDRTHFILGKNILNPQSSPIIAQRMNLKEISEITHQSYYPFILRPDPVPHSDFIRDWIITTVIPARHISYAIQWFAFALILCIGFFCFCVERVKNQGENHGNQ